MKCFIVAACLLAVASASNLGYYGAPWAHQAQHIPTLDAHGFQLDTPEVADAKAAHFAAHADAHARTGHVAHGVYSHAVAPVHHAPIAAPLAYAGHYAGNYAAAHYGAHIPSFDAHGYQLDTPEVAAAKAAHFAAYAKEAHRHKRSAVTAYAAPWAYGYHGQHIPTLDAHGFQLDTPEVAHAKAAHFAAHAEARARTGYGVVAPWAYAGHAVAAPVAYAHHAAPLAISHAGVPLDTPEVAHAKAAHFAAHAEAAARSHHY